MQTESHVPAASYIPKLHVLLEQKHGQGEDCEPILQLFPDQFRTNRRF
jgi:hypothetical protein